MKTSAAQLTQQAEYRRTHTEEIRGIYEEAERLTKATGIKHSVDHDIPLRGKMVSGLHVHTNLKAIPLVDNIRKGNRYE